MKQLENFPRLTRDFFTRSVTKVGPDLLGKGLIIGDKTGVITETEAYGGAAEPDDSSHAAKGITPRCAPMFSIGGTVYVYFTYGMHYCFNLSTEEEGVGAAVLIRAVITAEKNIKTDGPAKLCRYFGLNKEHNFIDAATAPDFRLVDCGAAPAYDITPRIGISRAKAALRRYVVKDARMSAEKFF